MIVELLSGLQVSVHGSCTGVGPAELLSRAKLWKVKLLFLTRRQWWEKKVNFVEHLSVLIL